MDGVLFYVGVGAWHIGFGLVVVVVADEVLHRVVGEEALELAIELGGQRLVRRQDDGGALRGLDHLGHGVGLAATGDAEQHLRAVVAADAFDQFLDRGRLVALRLVFGLDLEAHAAFGFLQARRPVRVQTFTWPSSPLNSGRPSRIRFSSASAVALTPSASILLRGGRASASSSSSAVGRPSWRAEFGVERGDGRRRAVVGLGASSRPLVAADIAFGDVFAGSLGRGARAVRRRLAAGAAVPRIVRRRLQAGARAHAGIAAVDRGIEQFGQRRSDRLHVRSVGLGLRGLRFRGFWIFGTSGVFAMTAIWDCGRPLKRPKSSTLLVDPPQTRGAGTAAIH